MYGPLNSGASVRASCWSIFAHHWFAVLRDACANLASFLGKRQAQHNLANHRRPRSQYTGVVPRLGFSTSLYQSAYAPLPRLSCNCRYFFPRCPRQSDRCAARRLLVIARHRIGDVDREAESNEKRCRYNHQRPFASGRRKRCALPAQRCFYRMVRRETGQD